MGGLKEIPIRQIAEYARGEMGEVIKKEEELDLDQGFKAWLESLEIPDRATVNFQEITSWLEEGRWTRQYFDIRFLELCIDRDWAKYLKANFIWGSYDDLMLRQHGFWFGSGSMSHKADPNHFFLLWDRDKDDFVKKLATLSRVKLAQKILKKIKDL